MFLKKNNPRLSSLRWQIFIYYNLATVLVVSVVFYLTYELRIKELNNDFDMSVYNYAIDLMENVKIESVNYDDQLLNSYLDADHVFPFPQGSSLVEIYKSNGQRVLNFSLSKNPPDIQSMVTHLLKNPQDNMTFWQIHNSERWRGLILQLDDSKNPQFYFVVVVSNVFLQAQIQSLKSSLFGGAVGLLMLLCALSLFIAQKVLGPIERLSEETLTIAKKQKEFRVSDNYETIELQQLSKNINFLLDRLDQVLNNHKQFSLKAAHQLKTPLTILRGQLEDFSSQIKNNKFSQQEALLFLSEMIKEVDHLAQVITKLLLLAEIQSGYRSLLLKKIDLTELLFRCCDRHQYLMDQKKIKLNIFIQEEQSLQAYEVITDEELLEVVLANILENAIKYVTTDKIDIQIRQNNHEVVLQIQNEFQDMFLKQDHGSLAHNLHFTAQGLGSQIIEQLAQVLEFEWKAESVGNSYSVKLQWPKNINKD